MEGAAGADYASGLPFDLRTKQFVVPEAPEGPSVPTVFDLTELYFRQHLEWEPGTKEAAARSFNRARRWLLAPGAEPAGKDLAALEDFLVNASFLPAHLEGRITDHQRAGRAWLGAHSAPADSLSSAQIEGFVARCQISERNPTKRVSATSLIRFLQPLKACWAWGVSCDDLPIDRSPWVVVRPRRKVKGKSTMTTGRGAIAVDVDMVLDVPQSLALAAACASEGTWGGIVECFVLVMALSGLRPGEAVGLLWEDVELPSDGGWGWLAVRRSHRPTPERWLDPDEDPEWGPLKDRDLAESRRAPVPPLLAAKLRCHRDLYGEGPGGLVFHRNGKPFDHDMFGRSVWEPARSKLFPRRTDLAADDPRQPKLSRLRRHDLRHAACSWWLRERVDVVVCQRWSGHRTLSVFLDIYQGVAPGREHEGIVKGQREFLVGGQEFSVLADRRFPCGRTGSSPCGRTAVLHAGRASPGALVESFGGGPGLRRGCRDALVWDGSFRRPGVLVCLTSTSDLKRRELSVGMRLLSVENPPGPSSGGERGRRAGPGLGGGDRFRGWLVGVRGWRRLSGSWE